MAHGVVDLETQSGWIGKPRSR